VKTALLLSVAFLAAACASAAVSPPAGKRPAGDPIGPPAAWIETSTGASWLGFSSYCWSDPHVGRCADAGAPVCGHSGVPNVRVERGETVRAHLGYTPDEASVEGAEAKLDGRTVTWHVGHAGPFVLFTRGKGKDASYVGCAVFS
jgi:hypothetical protein